MDLIDRQAAIDAVSKACFELRGVFGQCEDALKALPSAKPQSTMGQQTGIDQSTKDLISRQAAIDVLCSRCYVNKPETCSTIKEGDKWCEEVYTLLNLPSVEPEQKKGRWIRTTKADYAWECSACGYGLCDNRTTYCYDCGARMDSEEKNETLPHVD